MTGEVLDTTGDASILQSLEIVGNHGRSHLRIIAEGTGADDDVVGVGVHVGHRGEIHVETVSLKICTYGVAALVGIGRIASVADGSHRLVLLHMEVRIVGDAGHATALLVDAKQRRTVELP